MNRSQPCGPHRARLHHLVALGFAAVLLAACGSGRLAGPPKPDSPGTAAAGEADPDDTGAARELALRATPLTLRIDHAPVPVEGSDARWHVVYEIEVANLTGDPVRIDRLDVLDAQGGRVVGSFDRGQLASRLVVRDAAAEPGRLGASQLGMLYLHLVFESRAALPKRIDHRFDVTVGRAPDRFVGARSRVEHASELVFDAPLRGPRYIAGDGCCDAVRHIRASLPLNGRLYTAQRFAIDWERLDEQGRIYVGDPKNPASYIIYGDPVYAVADGRVAAAVDGEPDSPPGGFPEHIALDKADGNHVVLDLGGGRHALYAHLKPHSVRVREGQRVHRGQLLGQVGSSGNSSEPHLHFHVMDGPSPLAANGLPYRLRQFDVARRGVSTAAFDQAIIDGKPLPTEAVAAPGPRQDLLPLDLWIVDFPQ